MILVQNHPLRLSGSKILWIALCCSILLSSCGVLGPVFKKKPKTPTEEPKDTEEEKNEPEAPVEDTEEVIPAMEVALVLPLQLNHIQNERPDIEDVRRVVLPLAFYQGFRLGMEASADKAKSFNVKVLDSRDDENYSRTLSESTDVQGADLIVGPIFPKEIKAFSGALKTSDVLLVSPLAASTPSEFNFPNLVSLVPPVTRHAEAMVDYLKDHYKEEDQIFIYSNDDPGNDKFLAPVKTYLQEANIPVQEIETLEDLETRCTLSGRNVFIMGSTNRYAIMSAMSALKALKAFGYTIEVYGHPNWAKMPFESSVFEGLPTRITSSSYIDSGNTAVRAFQKDYQSAFKIEPSEYAYKGYDTGYFFGYMLSHYGNEAGKALEKEQYKGLQTSYTFEADPDAGYVNTYIEILQFRGTGFRPVEP